MIYFDNELRCFTTDSDKPESNKRKELAKHRLRTGQTLDAVRKSVPQGKLGTTMTGVKGLLQGRGYRHTQEADNAARLVSAYGSATGVKKDAIHAASGVMGGLGSAVTELGRRNRKYHDRKLLGFIPLKAKKRTLNSTLRDAGYIIDKYRSGAATGLERSKKITSKLDDEAK